MKDHHVRPKFTCMKMHYVSPAGLRPPVAKTLEPIHILSGEEGRTILMSDKRKIFEGLILGRTYFTVLCQIFSQVLFES